MIDISYNPFSHSNSSSARQTVGVPSKSAISIQSSPSVASSWNIKDEYVPSAAVSSDFYKRPSTSSVPLKMSEETARKGEVTDAMREEMTSGNDFWSAMDLLPIAYPSVYKIIDQVLIEKGIDLESSEGYYKTWSINPDGVFIFHPDKSNTNGVDPDVAVEVCMALESALNSSFLNVKENPHLFTKGLLPLDYDPAKWGRTIDRETWRPRDGEPDFSGFISELRSDIYKAVDKYSDSQIVDFSMKIDDQGKLTITGVQTKTNDPLANAQAMERLNSGLTGEIRKKAEYLGLLMLSAHHARNGDVLTEGTILEPFDDGSIGNIKQFKHEVVITSGSDYKVVQVLAR
jgi:hypothetical protein